MKTTMSSSSSSMSFPKQPTNYDELFMNQSLLFSDSLKDLKNLRTQLYSAAEYFEVSYTNDDQKETVVNTLKDYTIKALVNTVDHLGSITFKVNGLVDEKVGEVSATEFRFSCIEQRLQTCQAFIDHEGLTQQSVVITTPKYHKRYTLPDGEPVRASRHTTTNYQGYNREDEENWKKLKNAVRSRNINGRPSSIRNARSPSPAHTRPKHQGPGLNNDDNWKKLKDAVRGPVKNSPQFSIRKARSPSPTHTKPKHQGHNQDDEDNRKTLKNAVRGTIGITPQSSMKKARSPSPTPRPSLQPGLFSFRENQRVSDKRAESPYRSKFPLLRSGSTRSVFSRSTTPVPSRPTSSGSTRSVFSRSTTPVPSRPTTPNSSTNARKRYPSEPRKSISMRLNGDHTDNQKDIEHQPSKSKRILKALLSRRKSKKDDVLYSFLDEY